MELKARCAALLQYTISQCCFIKVLCPRMWGVTITVAELAPLLKAPTLATHLSANLHTHILISASGRPHTDHQGWVLKI